MTNFCGKCGTKIDENTGLCPNCDIIKKPKGHKGVKIIIGLFVLLLVASGTVFAFFSLRSFEKPNDTEKRAVISNKFGDFYNSGNKLFPLDNLDSLEPLMYYDTESSMENYVSFYNYRTAYGEDTIYAQEADITSELYKYKFTGAGKLERSVWVDENTLKNSVVCPDNEMGYTSNMVYFNKEGNYIYFICYPRMEFFAAQKDIAFKLGRISEDGNTIEFLNDEIASAYTVSNDWIYFYDNGYIYDNSLENRYKIESDRAGIYKMKCDGSQKQLLLGDFTKDSRDSCTYNTLCDKMNIYGEYLYFVNYSESGESKLYRMKTDGSGLECLTKNGVDKYTVDNENNDIYYTDGQFGQAQLEGRNLYKVSIDNNTEEKLLDGAMRQSSEFSYYDHYIYFTNYSMYSMGNNVSYGSIIGMRYDLIDGKTDLFKGDRDKTVEIDSDGFPIAKFSDPVFAFVEDSETDILY